MARIIKRALLIVNLNKDDARRLLTEISRELTTLGIDVAVCAFEGKPNLPPDGEFDIALSLGGDGTVLFSARCLANRHVPILPINLGTLGFIAAVQRDDWYGAFQAWNDGSVAVSERLMLHVSVERHGRVLVSHQALNDAVVAAAGISKIIKLKVGTADFTLGHYRADGLIVATPTGSTAYSIAAGGPILDPEMDVMIINPVCPFTLSNRPIVVPDHETIIIEVESEQRSDVLLTIDGQEVVSLEPLDKVIVERAADKALLIACERWLFYRTLRSKLNWSGGPDA